MSEETKNKNEQPKDAPVTEQAPETKEPVKEAEANKTEKQEPKAEPAKEEATAFGIGYRQAAACKGA